MSDTSSSDWSYAAFLAVLVIGCAFGATVLFKEAARGNRLNSCIKAGGDALKCAEATR